MHTRYIRNTWVIIFLLGLLIACHSETDEEQAATEENEEKPVVQTTVYPVKFLVDRIGGDFIDARYPLEDGVDPTHWEPDRETIRELQSADLIFLQGAGLEDWRNTVSLPGNRTVDTTSHFSEQILERESSTHAHGPGGEHAHAEQDPYTWLNPALLKMQAERIRIALEDLLPEDSHSTLQDRHLRLNREIDDLQGLLVNGRTHTEDALMLAVRRRYNYIAREFDWNMENMDIDASALMGGEESEWETCRQILRERQPDVMLWNEEPGETVKNRLESIPNVKTVVFRDLAHPPPEERSRENYFLTRMETNIQNLLDALRNGSPEVEGE